MEQREILIANTKTQKTSKLTTDATTLSELKAAMDAAGIDYYGMTFTEGISKTQLIDDSTQLPHDLQYKGKVTNNLVILLTNTKKKIASGAMSRKEAYQAVKDNNLQDAVKKNFGKNFTQVSTAELISFLDKSNVKMEKATREDVEESTKEVETEIKETKTEVNEEGEDNEDYDEDVTSDVHYTLKDIIIDSDMVTLNDSLFVHIAMLANKKILSVKDIKELQENLNTIINVLNEENCSAQKGKVSTSDGSITDDDVDDILNELGM